MRGQMSTEQNVDVLVVSKTYGEDHFVGLGVASDGCDLTPQEARTIARWLNRSAKEAES